MPGSMSLNTDFPRLHQSGFVETSPADRTYNCIAFAAGRSDAWWEPVAAPGYYWPPSVQSDESVDALTRLFETLGYEQCMDGRYEPGYDRVAIYANGTEYSHAALQVREEWWVSKLGKSIDIQHKLGALEGGIYGHVARFLRRPRLTREG